MTVRVTISLPDDVAAELDGMDNVSAHIADLLRHEAGVRRTREMLASWGFQITEEGIARMRHRLHAAQQAIREGRSGVIV